MDTLASRLQASLGDAFTIERELGGGGMSRVFVARERALDRQLVIKTLDLETSDAGSAERFRREVRTIAKLQHPHIVPLLTTGGDDSLLWYAMPFAAPTPAPKIITDRQARVMLGVIVVALIVAAAVVGTWWARRAGAAPRVTEGADVISVAG